MTSIVNDTSDRLRDLSAYTYGTTRLGDEKIDFTDRVKLARAAMDAGVWFHTSDQYGSAQSVLRAAFDEDRAHVPPMFFKIGNNTIDELRGSIQKQIDVVGIDHMAIGQLCLGGQLAAEIGSGGKAYEELQAIKDEGLVDRFVLEVFPWTSDIPLAALRAGHAARVVDAYIFYLNPLQRFASNPLWDLLQETSFPIVAMRTVGGGDVHRLRDVPGAAWREYLQKRAVEVAPIFERSGVPAWAEFCVRFAYSFPEVRTTVGSTSHVDRLQEFIQAAAHPEPLPVDIVNEITGLQHRWSDETDVLAEPWTM